MRRQLTIGTKLTLGICALLLSLLIMGFASWRAISALGDSLDEAVNRTARKLDLIGAAQEAFEKMKSLSTQEQLADAIAELERNAGAKDRGRSACHARETAQESIHDLEAAVAVVRQRTGELRRLVSDPTAQDALDTADRTSSNWLAYSKDYLALVNDGHFSDGHTVLRDKMFPVLSEFEKAAKFLSQREREALAVSSRETHRTISQSRWMAFVLLGLNLLVAGMVLWAVSGITGTLRVAMAELSTGAEQVAASAGQVTAASQALAQGASQQAASLEETSASSEEIDSMARQNSQNSSTAAELVTRSQRRFTEAARSLEEMVLAMSEIAAGSSKIFGIVKVSDEIAFQTNILALNAAVEAARAGEAGLGFAVVAGEVRNLAQRSAQAARDTAALIEESIARSHAGKAKVDQVAAAIRAISEESTRVKTLVDQVDVGSQEQSRGIAQIGQAITQMDQVTQTAASSAEENAAASRELSTQAQAINLVVLRLRSLITGNNDTSTHAQIQLALAAHAMWKKRLSDAIETRSSGIAVGTARADDQCAVGKWIHGSTISRAIKQSADHQNCLELHRRFHIAAGNLLSLALAGKKEEADRALRPGSEFAQLSDSLGSALMAWDRKSSGQG